METRSSFSKTTESIMPIQNQSTTQTNIRHNRSVTNSILVCPFCCNNMPFLKFHKMIHGIITFTIDCRCLQKSKQISLTELTQFMRKKPIIIDKCNTHQDKTAHTYCPQCCQWFCEQCISITTDLNSQSEHIHLIEYPINLKCPDHKNDFVSYCNDCKLNLCKLCDFDPHQNHSKVSISIELKGIDNYTDNLIEKNKEDIYNYINQFKNHKFLNKTNKETLAKNIKYIDDLYKNEQFNDIVVIYTCIRKTLRIIKETKTILKQVNTLKSLFNNRKNLFMELPNCLEDPFAVLHLNNLKEIVLNSIQFSSQKMTKIVYHEKNNFRQFNNGIIAYETSQEITLCDLSTLKCTTTLKNSLLEEKFCIVDQLYDGRLAYKSHNRMKIFLWDLKTDHFTHELQSKASIFNILQLHDHTLLLFGDNNISKWNISTYQCIQILHMDDDDNDTNQYIQLKDGQLICYLYTKLIIVFYDSNTFQEKGVIMPGKNIKEYYGDLHPLFILSDGQLAVPFNDTTISLWNTTTYQCNVVSEKQNCTIIRLIEYNKGLLGSYEDNTFRTFDISTLKCTCIINQNYFCSNYLKLNDGRLIYNYSRSLYALEIGKENDELKMPLFTDADLINKSIQLTDGRIAYITSKAIKITNYEL